MNPYNSIADILRHESPDSSPYYVYSELPLGRRSMSPTPARDVASTTSPEPKSSGGLASSIFKSLTGGGKSKAVQATSTITPSTGQQSKGSSSRQATGDSGPPDLEKFYEQLKANNPLQIRVSAAEALKYAVQDYPLDGVASIFNAGKDLIQPTNPQNARIAGYELIKACVRHEISSDPQRLAYFEAISAEGHPDDFHLQLDALVELARNGKDLSGFHYGVIPLLTNWLKDSFAIVKKNRKLPKPQQGSSQAQVPIGEETNLDLLFTFTVDVIKFGFNVSSGENTNDLIDAILHICVCTTLSKDLKACIAVIDAIIIYGEMPNEKLAECVKVLCSIHGAVNEVQPESWRSLSNLGKSHHGQVTVRVLLDILRDSSADLTSDNLQLREIRGAISVLQRLFSKNAQDGYPLVPFTLLMEALSKVLIVEHWRIANDVMNLILSILNDDNANNQAIMHNVMEEDWSLMFQIVSRCAQRIVVLDEQYSPSRIGSPLSKEENSKQNSAKTLSYTLGKLVLRVQELLNKFSDDFFQREDCIRFLISIHQHLPESASDMVVSYYVDRRYCYPSNLHHFENIGALLEAFFADRSKPIYIRLHALKAVTSAYKAVYSMEQQFMDTLYVDCIIKAILKNIGDEKEIDVLQEVMSVAVMVTEFANDTLFTWIINAIRAVFLSDSLQSPLGSPLVSQNSTLVNGSTDLSAITNSLVQSPSNVVAKALVHVFMKTMHHSAFKALRAFDELLWVAKSQDCERDARISALKMLFRLRADWGNWIFITPFTESDGLAASLYRTQPSLARKQAADQASLNQRLAKVEDTANSRPHRQVSSGHAQAQVRTPTRTISGLHRTLQRNHQMWMSPDPEALPESAFGEISEILVSVVESSGEEDHIATFYHAVDQIKQARLRTIARKSEPDYVEGERELLSEAKYNELMGYSVPERSDEQDEEQTELAQNKESDHQKLSPTPLNIPLYLETIISLMQRGCDWEIYSYILVHLPSQLTNQALFKLAIPQIKILRGVLCDQIKNNSFLEPPVSSGLRKADVAICLFQILNMVMSYHRYFSKTEHDEIVQTFIKGVGEKTSKSCIHALSICCHELPVSTSKTLVSLLQKMSQIITQSHNAVHILEFLACLARLPNIYVNFREEEYRIVFAICFRYLQYVRDQNGKESNRNSQVNSRTSFASTDSSRALGDSGESNFQPNTSDELPQYVYALAYHVMIFWFLSLKLEDRAGQVSWITKNLVFTDVNGKETIDEQAQVTLDFMQRVAYADVEESAPDPEFTPENYGPIKKNRWIIGNSLVTIEQATRGGWGQITKRQPSGTSSYIIREKFNRPPPHQIPPPRDPARKADAKDNAVLPSHLLLQIAASVPQSADAVRPLPLPMDDYMERFTRLIERLFTVDSHKVGVIYIGENQTEEAEILANTTGNTDYTEFLLGLGTLVKLQDAKFNTQGLDRQGSDGTHVTCWRDRVTEIIFHVTTRMPTDLKNDPRCIRKKSHIGNDFVNIIFNNSGHPFKFDTFPSEFNYVNIVITPESRETFLAARSRSQEKKQYSPFFKVQVMSKPGFPEISPAAEVKIVSLKALPGFVRLIALNASVFSLVWANRHGGENVSSWRTRLREINRVRERYTPKPVPAQSPPGTASGAQENNKVRDAMMAIRRSSVAFISNSEPASQRSSVLSTTDTEVGPSNAEGSLVDSLDFSRWAAPK